LEVDTFKKKEEDAKSQVSSLSARVAELEGEIEKKKEDQNKEDQSKKDEE